LRKKLRKVKARVKKTIKRVKENSFDRYALLSALLGIVLIISIVTRGFTFTPHEGIKGENGVVIIELLTPDCPECYDPSIHELFFQASNISVAHVNKVNTTSDTGRNLIEAYDVPIAPTIIVSPELSGYPNAVSGWERIGKVVNGYYVFTNTDVITKRLLGIYKDLRTNEVITPVPVINIENKTNCGNDSVVRVISFLSSTNELSSDLRDTLLEVKEELGDHMELILVASPLSPNETEIKSNKESCWFSISWSESQRLLREYEQVFMGGLKMDNKTGVWFVTVAPITVINCYKARLGTMKTFEKKGYYAPNTEKRDLLRKFCAELQDKPNACKLTS